MKKAIFIIALFLLVACSAAEPKSNYSCKSNQTVIINTEQNHSDIIIVYKNQTKTDCKNSCTRNYCIGNDYYLCVNNTNECSYPEKKGRTIGQCGVYCFTSQDCEWYQDCMDVGTKSECVNVTTETRNKRDLLMKETNISY